MSCQSLLVFADDYGDNSCTMHCELEAGHEELHRETRQLPNGQAYTIVLHNLLCKG